jgi:hypothetical protein
LVLCINVVLVLKYYFMDVILQHSSDTTNIYGDQV